MLTFLLYVGCVVLALIGAAGAAIFGVTLGRHARKSMGMRSAAMMALAVTSFFNFIPPETITISEPSEEMKVKKGVKPGDPPEPD
jgi:hypothetical protein